MSERQSALLAGDGAQVRARRWEVRLRWQTDGKDCQNLPFQKVPRGLARNGGHGEQPAGGRLWRGT